MKFDCVARDSAESDIRLPAEAAVAFAAIRDEGHRHARLTTADADIRMPYGGGPKSGCDVRVRPMKSMKALDCGSTGALEMS